MLLDQKSAQTLLLMASQILTHLSCNVIVYNKDKNCIKILDKKFFIHKNRGSLQLAILYEILQDQCEEVDKEGPMVKPDHIRRLKAMITYTLL